MLNKQKIFGLLILFFFSSYAFCVDRVVQLNGPSGTYNSITDAVNASSDGDIIIVNNKPSNLPWIEDVTISKSLTFVSALDTVQFFVQGNYFIERGANREVVINGMRNNNGNIEETGTNTPTSRTKVSILNCEINGDVDFGQRYNLLISNSAIFDQVNFTYGSVYGSEIGGYMQLNRDFWADSDTLNIVGNKLFRLTLTTDSHYVHVLNNFIYNTNTGGIYVGALKGGTGENHITNNSIYSRYDAINAFVSTQAILIIQNNALRSTTTNDHSFDNNSGPGLQVVFNYNVYHSVEPSSLISSSNLTNTALARSFVNFNVDGSNFFSQGDDAGNPSHEYFDLDLSTNDIGCYGGSYSFDNFHPLNDHKSSRVGFISVPRTVYQGQSFTLRGIGFDK